MAYKYDTDRWIATASGAPRRISTGKGTVIGRGGVVYPLLGRSLWTIQA